MKKYFPSLDGLRLLASVNIVLLHLDSSWLLTYARGWDIVYPAIKAPLFGASIFFILAGFIYSVKFSDAAKVPATWTFLKERFHRLYPLHVLCTLLILGYVGSKTTLFQDPALVVRSVLLHISLLWAFVPAWGHSLNQPSWALSAFLICYLLAPRFARYLNREHSLRWLWILLGLALLPSIVWGIVFVMVDYTESRYLFFHIFPPIRAFEFLFGMILARVHMKGGLTVPRHPWISDIALLGVLGMLYVNIFFHKTPFAWVNWFSHHTVNTMLYALLLLLLAHSQGNISRLFSWSPIRALGKSSFYPYLWHMPLIGASYLISDRLKYWIPNCWLGTLAMLTILYGGSVWFSERQKLRRGAPAPVRPEP